MLLQRFRRSLRPPRPTLVVAILVAAAFAGCQLESPSQPRERTMAGTRSDFLAAQSAPSPASLADATGRAEVKAPSQSQSAAASDTAVVPSMIIRTGNASVRVDSLETAIEQVKQLALRFGGWIANTSMQTGPEQIRAATLTLKLPSSRYEDALGGLDPIGELETVQTTAEDVGEEFVDVQARVANGRRLEARLVTLLATRTGKLEDVLAVERELARVREEIERSEGRIRYLRTRVALSTLTVTVHEDAPLLGSNPSANVIGDAFVAAWRNFVALLAGAIAMLGVAVPLAVLGAAIVVVGRRFDVTSWLRGGRAAGQRPEDGGIA